VSDSRAQMCRPLRKDAERNRQRILSAARALFAEHGTSVSHDQLAEAADVAVGTVYRRFPDKDSLLEALFADDIERVEALGRAALAVEDPWAALVGFVTDSLELQAANRGFKEFLMSNVTSDSMTDCRARLMPMIDRLVERAQAAGVLRPGVTSTDIGMIPLMVSPVMDGSRGVDPQLWRRALDIALEGIRASSCRTRLPDHDLAPEMFFEVMQGAYAARGRR